MSEEPADLLNRLTELEVKLVYAEDLLDSLNQTVFRQQEQIDLLQREVRHLYRQLKELGSTEDAGPHEPRDEIPPHY